MTAVCDDCRYPTAADELVCLDGIDICTACLHLLDPTCHDERDERDDR